MNVAQKSATKRVFWGSIERVSSLIGKQPTLTAVKNTYRLSECAIRQGIHILLRRLPQRESCEVAHDRAFINYLKDIRNQNHDMKIIYEIPTYPS